jgi:hypothetical protein
MTQNVCCETQLKSGKLIRPSLWLCWAALFVAGNISPTHAQIVQGEPGGG